MTAPTKPTPTTPAAPPPDAAPPSREDIARYRENLQGEIDAIALYALLAEIEESAALKHFYSRMVEVETVHATVWRERVDAVGIDTSGMSVGWRYRVLMFVARHFGPSLVVPTIAEREAADEGMYDDQPEARPACPATSGRTPACSASSRPVGRRGRGDCPYRGTPPLAPAATRCGPPCWAQTTGSFEP